MTALNRATQVHLHFDESDGVWRDISPARRKVEAFGTGVSASASSKFGANCLALAGGTTSSGVRIIGVPYTMGGAFGARLNLFLTGAPAGQVQLISDAYNFGLELNADRTWQISLYNAGGSRSIFSGGVAIALNTWVDLEIGFDGISGVYGFADGVRQIAGTYGPSNFSTNSVGLVNNLQVGARGGATAPCRIDEVLYITDGILHTSDFTPATAAYADADPITGIVVPGVVRERSEAPPSAQPKLFLNARRERDMNFGGGGQIVGTVKEKATPTNIPLSRRVRLYNEAVGAFVQETWSDAAGNYTFRNIDRTARYSVVTYDFQQSYRAVIADNLLAEATP